MMGKEEFLKALRRGMSGHPEEEIQRRLSFYSEMIEDRMEEGLSEEEAVAAVNSVEALAFEQETEHKAPTPRKNMALVIAGSPLWIPLVIAAGAVVFSLWILLWSLVVSFWAAFVGACGGLVGGIVSGIWILVGGNMASGLFLVGCSFLCAGAAILLFFVARETAKGMVWLTKKLFQWCKRGFSPKKEDTV